MLRFNERRKEKVENQKRKNREGEAKYLHVFLKLKLQTEINGNITQCVADANVTLDDFETAFADLDAGFKNKSLSDIISGLEGKKEEKRRKKKKKEEKRRKKKKKEKRKKERRKDKDSLVHG